MEKITLIWKLDIMDHLRESRFCPVMLEVGFDWVDGDPEGKRSQQPTHQAHKIIELGTCKVQSYSKLEERVLY